MPKTSHAHHDAVLDAFAKASQLTAGSSTKTYFKMVDQLLDQTYHEKLQRLHQKQREELRPYIPEVLDRLDELAEFKADHQAINHWWHPQSLWYRFKLHQFHEKQLNNYYQIVSRAVYRAHQKGPYNPYDHFES